MRHGDLRERFNSHYDIDETSGCWIWRGARLFGYGRLHFNYKNLRAHRVAYFLAHGVWPECIDHLCRNRACVNPSHLEAVSVATNTLRGVSLSAENARKTHCKRGHPLSGKNLVRRKDDSRECRICDDLRRRGRIADSLASPTGGK